MDGNHARLFFVLADVPFPVSMGANHVQGEPVRRQPEGPLGGRRIVVVDDQDHIRELLEETLTQAGAEVWCAPDGHEALTAIEASSPDLILLDLGMPGLHGWDVLERLATTASAHVPVILQTSADDFGSFDRAKRFSVAAFISKPFRLGEVTETCRRVLEGARPLQGRGESAAPAESVEVQDDQGVFLESGLLLDLDKVGAQVELQRPLRIAQRVTVTAAGRTLAERAEVRWVTHLRDRFQHGLALRRD